MKRSLLFLLLLISGLRAQERQTDPTWLHRYVLVVMAYSYLASAFIGIAITRLRHRGGAAIAHRPTDDSRRSAPG